MESKYKKVIEVAERAGKIISGYFGKELVVEEKSTTADFRTKADIESEAVIIGVLEKIYPKYNIISEERGDIAKGSDSSFIIDPLDGSNNFVLGIPHFSVSIALIKNKEIVFGVIHHPVTKQTVWAEKGKGAWEGGSQLQVNREANLRRATVAYNCGYETPHYLSDKIQALIYHRGAKRVLKNWAPAWDFALLAAGKSEGIINHDNEEFDYAAGKLIAAEAGAIITNFHGKGEVDQLNNEFIVANSDQILSELKDVLEEAI
ncbi:MAG: inositol monophosphatase [Patescibacteria group bacterium]